MRKPDPNDPGMYEVQTGEVVTLQVTAFGTAELVQMGVDGTTLSPPFQFTVTKRPGERHIVSTNFSFSPGATDARYEVNITGSRGGSFAINHIRPGGIQDPDFTFVVLPGDPIAP